MDKITIQLTREQLNIIAMALGQLPYKTVAGLIAEIAIQVPENK